MAYKDYRTHHYERQRLIPGVLAKDAVHPIVKRFPEGSTFTKKLTEKDMGVFTRRYTVKKWHKDHKYAECKYEYRNGQEATECFKIYDLGVIGGVFGNG